MVNIENIEVGKEYYFSLHNKNIIWWAVSEPYNKGRSTYIDIRQHVFLREIGLLVIDEGRTITKTDLKTGYRGRV